MQFVMMTIFILSAMNTQSSWLHDWIQNPNNNGLTSLATVGTMIGTVLTVIVALFTTKKALKEQREQFEKAQIVEQENFDKEREESKQQFRAAQQQTQEALEENREQFLESRYAMHRPLLIPDVKGYNDAHPSTVIPDQYPCEDNAPFHTAIKNIGSGVALNMQGVIAFDTTYTQRKQDFMFIHADPVPAKGDGVSATFTHYKFSDDSYLVSSSEVGTKDGTKKYTLAMVSTHGASANNIGKVCRLTLTYTDIFGRIHASIFDYLGEYQWVFVDFLEDIGKDLMTLAKETAQAIASRSGHKE